MLRVVAFRGLYEDLRIDDLTNPTPTRQPYRAPKGDKSSGGVGKQNLIYLNERLEILIELTEGLDIIVI